MERDYTEKGLGVIGDEGERRILLENQKRMLKTVLSYVPLSF
jgi:hypothetical protein